MAKLDRGLERDLGDIQAMLALGLTGADAIWETFASIEPEPCRFRRSRPRSCGWW